MIEKQIIKKQVLSIKQMKQLIKLGVEPNETLMYWGRQTHDAKGNPEKGKWFLTKGTAFMHVGFMAFEMIPAYTLSELLESLPKAINIDGTDYFLSIYVTDNSEWAVDYIAENIEGNPEMIARPELLEAAYERLIWIIKKNLKA